MRKAVEGTTHKNLDRARSPDPESCPIPGRRQVGPHRGRRVDVILRSRQGFLSLFEPNTRSGSAFVRSGSDLNGTRIFHNANQAIGIDKRRPPVGQVSVAFHPESSPGQETARVPAYTTTDFRESQFPRQGHQSPLPRSPQRGDGAGRLGRRGSRTTRRSSRRSRACGRSSPRSWIPTIRAVRQSPVCSVSDLSP